MSDGGPAFPIVTNDMPVQGEPGMSIRDYAQIHLEAAWVVALSGRYHEVAWFDEGAGAEAHKLAKVQVDAMLTEREGGENE